MNKYLFIKREIEETQRLYQVEAEDESKARDILEGYDITKEAKIKPLSVKMGIKRTEFISFKI